MLYAVEQLAINSAITDDKALSSGRGSLDVRV